MITQIPHPRKYKENNCNVLLYLSIGLDPDKAKKRSNTKLTYNLENFIEQRNIEARTMVRVNPYDYTKFIFKKHHKIFRS
jgi:hypothetical protein